MQIERPLVSVIVPVYNVAAYVDQCLASIAAQTYPYLQVVVVDDGSTDGSSDLCDAWATRDGRFEVVHQENRGLSAARNVGLDRARGDYVTFVDSDDYVVEGFVETLLSAALGLQVDCVMYGFAWLRESGETASMPCPQPEVVAWQECLHRFMDQQSYQPFHIDAAPWSRIYARTLFEDFGIRFPEGRTYEGTATLFPLTYHSNREGLIPDVLYMHRSRPGSIVRTASDSNLIDSFSSIEKLYADIAEHCPDLARYAKAARERACISACLVWLNDEGERQHDVAEIMFGAVKREALRNWRDRFSLR